MITHQGIITRVSRPEGTVTVNISPEATECNGCAISGLCSKREEIDVPYTNPTDAMIGRHVTVGTEVATQRRGIVLFFVIPILLLVGVLYVCMACGMGDAVASVVSIGAIAVWYVILFALRVRIQSEARFKIIEH